MAQKLDADLNIIQRSGIEIEVDPLTKDLNIIQQLDDEPNDVGGLSAQELKAKFDEAGNAIKDYINDSLIPQVLEDGLTEQARQEHEAERQANEAQRQENEEARIAAEAAREEAAANLNQSLSESVDQLEAGIEAAEAARNVWEDYDGAKAYVPGNKVYYLGSSYVNTAPCQNVLPTVAEYWQIIAKKGADSDEGMSQEEGDLRYLKLSGGIMTGPLSVLPPTEPGHPATKEYADEIKTRAEDTYPKAQSLSANTRAMLGLDTEATPDGALAELGKYHQYWWKRTEVFLGAQEQLTLSSETSTSIGSTIIYSSYIYVASGSPSLAGYSSMVVSYGKDTSELNNLYQKYIVLPDSPDVYYATSKPTKSGSGTTSSPYTVKINAKKVSVGTTEYVRANSAGAYPNGSVSDGYFYEALGMPLEAFKSISTYFTYMGTGTYGSANKTTLTFPFNPKLVIVNRVGLELMAVDSSPSSQKYNYAYRLGWFMWTQGTGRIHIYESSSDNGFLDFQSGYRYLSFYSVTSAGVQLNSAGVMYRVVAFG